MTVWDVRWLAECGSTMAEVRALARVGAPEGLVVWTDHQTAGRGRLGRTWEAPPGSSLLCSMLLRPERPGQRETIRVALALVEAVEALTPARPGLKWPNDLLVDVPGFGERKLAGILAEAEQDDRGWAVVVGFGLNVAWPPLDEVPVELPAVALSHLGPPPDRETLLQAALARLEDPPADLAAAYLARCVTIGRRVRAELPASVVTGEAVGVTADGALVVATPDGDVVVQAADVVHVR